MTLEWEVYMETEFPEDDLEEIVNLVRENEWDDDNKIITCVNDTVTGFDDCIYYAWGDEQTMAVVNEIKRRLGGIQLSMFDSERSVKGEDK